MTPKEFDFVCAVLRETAVAAYLKRDEEVQAGKPLNTEQFVFDNRHKLILQKQLDASTKRKVK